MPVYRVLGSDGAVYRVEGAENASSDELISAVESQLAAQSKQAGFWRSFGEGATTLGSLPEAAKFGLINTPEARQELIADQASKRAKTSWADVQDIPSFVNWARQTAGTSMGYLATPGVAGAVAQGLSKTPGVGRAVGLGLLGAQYLTENLGRQAGQQEIAETQGQVIKPASIGRAALAAAGQTGLDVIGFKFFEPAFKALPFVGKLFGKEGAEAAKEAGEQLADAIAKGTIRYSEKVAIGAGKGIAFEVPQEIAQQALERWQAKLPLADEDARREYGEAMAGAVLLGGGLGGLEGAVEAHTAHEEARQAVVNKEKEKEAIARQAREAARKATVTSSVTGEPKLVTAREVIKEKQAAQRAAEELKRQEQIASGAVSVENPLLREEPQSADQGEKLPENFDALLTKKEATNAPKQPAVVPKKTDAEAAGTRVGVPPQEASTDTVQVKDAESSRLDNIVSDIGRSPEGEVGVSAALRPEGRIIGPEIQLTDAERAALEAAPNVAPAWPDQRFYAPKPKIKIDEESQTILNEIQSLQERVPNTPDTLLARNRLKILQEKVSRNENLNPRDVADLSKLMEQFSKEELARGTPREDLIPLLEADERATGQSRELVQDINEYGQPVFTKDGTPKMVYTPTKWATILKRLSGSDNPLVRAMANLLRYAHTTSSDASEAELLPQDVEVVKELRRQGKTINTEAEVNAIRGRRARIQVYDEEGKPILDEEGEPVTKLGPFPKYGHPYLSKKHYNIAGKKADRTTNVDAFRPNLILEGSEKFDNAEIIARLKAAGRDAEYDPKTNTIVFTKEGVNDKTILHELLHAFTVGVLRQYEIDPDKLTPEQHRAVKQIFRVMDIAKKSGLAGKYPTAFESIYEFVSHAMTEPKLREDLKRLKAPTVFTAVPKGTKAEIEKGVKSAWKGDFVNAAKNLWNVFTRAVVRLLAPGIETDGNALLELSEAVGHILTVPTALKSKWGRGMKPLASTRAQATVMVAPELAEQTTTAYIDDNQLKLQEVHKPFTAKQAVKFFIGTMPGYERLVRDLQNDRRPLKLLQDVLWMAGKLVVGKNNIFDVLTLSTQVAHWAMTNHLMEPMDRINQYVMQYAKERGISSERALAELDAYFVAEHEQERRHQKYLRFVPLEQFMKFKIDALDGTERTAAEHRRYIYNNLLAANNLPPKTQPEARLARIRQLRRIVEELVKEYRDVEGMSDFVKLNADQKADLATLDESSNLYDVIDTSPEMLEALRNEYAVQRSKHGTTIDNIKSAMRDMSEQTITLNKQSNYWSDPVDNFQQFYDWQHYVPLKGKPQFDERSDEAMFERFTSKSGGGYEYIEAQEGFMGRKSKADNVILQTMVDGAKSALRYGRKDVAPTLKNLIDSKYIIGSSNDIGKGKNKSIIKFEDRYGKNKEVLDKLNENSILYYKENGEIEILEISPSDKRYREAIRRAYREPTPLLNLANNITGFMGHMHTRYNPAFAPYNFIRDLLTNAFNIGAVYGPTKAAQYLGAIATRIASGGMGVASRISWLYHNGRIAEIEDMAREKDANGQLTLRAKRTKEIYDYLRVGGRVAYIMGVAHKGQLNELLKDANQGDFKRRWQKVNNYIDVWSDMFEFTARAGAFAVFKEHYMSPEGGGMNETQATQKAAADAKNLANFEQVGKYGREAGAIFMFFRPAATGAVAAIDSVRQIWWSDQKFIEELPNVLAQENVPGDPRGTLSARHREMKRNAYLMLGGLAGAGFMIYTMAMLAADDDEPDEFKRFKGNKILRDDPALWTRNIRLPLSMLDKESKTVLQIPWGFGLGAIGATGAQVAAFYYGAQDAGDFVGNMTNIALDSFIPIPVSRINPIDNPTAWVVDSAMPSALRPLVEFSMNKDGLGREIYNNRVTKYGDAALGGMNVPEGYHKAARLLRDITNGEVNVQPNTLYFWANNYADGLSRITQSLYGLGLVAAGDKQFEAKSEIMLLSSYLGRESNYDARMFALVQKEIEKKEAILNQFANNKPQLDRYLERDPYAPAAVYMFRKVENSLLRDIRKAINETKASNKFTAKERKEKVDFLNNYQNYIKFRTIERLKEYGVKPYEKLE